MRLIFVSILLSIPALNFGQITSTQQKALNSYVDYANQSAKEVEAVVKSIITYYPTMHQKSSWGAPRYSCPVQLEEYYLTEARKQSKAFSSVTTSLTTKLNELRAASEAIDSKCKALDTYHKLEDYKQDNFAKAESLISELQVVIADYRKKQHALQGELEAVYKKMTRTR